MSDEALLSVQLNRHYAPGDVSQRILDCLRAAGCDPEHLTREETASFDEFHGGGRESTRALARTVGLTPGLRVLDVGCGIGGPARTLTAEFGCVVTGVDLTHEFILAARMLSSRLGMAEQVTFVQGSALDLPLPDGGFDLVWSQNMLMNLPDRDRFAREAYRMLKPGGRCAVEAVVAGSGEVRYPCFWASRPELSFLSTADSLRASFRAAGFREVSFLDNTTQVLAHGRRRLALLERDGPPPLGIGVLVPEQVLEKTHNAIYNNEHQHTAAIQAVWQRDD